MPKRKKRAKRAPKPKEQVVDYSLLWEKIKTNKLTIPICILLLFITLITILLLLGAYNNNLLH